MPDSMIRFVLKGADVMKRAGLETGPRVISLS
ncbi:hypothetical protein GGE09_003888 [Roseobacter sp. N2S]|nr:hypothetical protein [Roseobacter sp. N2S]